MNKSKKNKNEKTKKLLVVCHHYWPEPFRLTDICEGFVENGYEVDILCGIPNYPAGKFFKGYGFLKKRTEVHNGVNIRRVLEIPRGNNSNFRIFLNYISFPLFSLFHIPRLLIKDYDRVFVYQLSPVLMAFPGIIIAKLKKIKLFIYITDFWPNSLYVVLNIKNKAVKNLVKKVSFWHYRQADGIIGVFKGIQRLAIEEVGIKKEKTIYIPQAPEKVYEQQIKDTEIRNKLGKGFKIMFAGSINPAQSFDVILAAAKEVFDQGYKDIKYVILGEGMSKKWVLGEVKRLGLEKNFIFEGLIPVEKVPKYQAEADALICALARGPISDYGIPAKVQSYMASGKPIIAAMDGEGQRLINNNGCGKCCDSGDVKNLAKIIREVADLSKKQREEMGKKGREYHFKHFERNLNLNRLIEFVFNDKRIVDNEYPD